MRNVTWNAGSVSWTRGLAQLMLDSHGLWNDRWRMLRTQAALPPTTGRRDGERTIVDLGGELDLASAPILNDYLKSLGSQADAVVYDLTHLTFIDVLGLRSLMASEKEPGQGISVRAPSFQVRRLLEICHLESIIEGSPTNRAP